MWLTDFLGCFFLYVSVSEGAYTWQQLVFLGFEFRAELSRCGIPLDWNNCCNIGMMNMAITVLRQIGQSFAICYDRGPAETQSRH